MTKTTAKLSVNSGAAASAGALQLLQGSLHKTYITLTHKHPGKKNPHYSKESGTEERRRGQRAPREELEAAWGVFHFGVGFFFFDLFVFFGIRVTALLKNASKQLQDSRDWMWAHKVVTVIQTSAVWTEGSRRLQRRLWNATAVPLNNKSVAESQSSLTESRNVAQRPRCCVKKLLVCGDVVCLFVFFGVFFFLLALHAS